MTVNADGSLSRIANWSKMMENEQQARPFNFSLMDGTLENYVQQLQLVLHKAVCSYGC